MKKSTAKTIGVIIEIIILCISTLISGAIIWACWNYVLCALVPTISHISYGMAILIGMFINMIFGGTKTIL